MMQAGVIMGKNSTTEDRSNRNHGARRARFARARKLTGLAGIGFLAVALFGGAMAIGSVLIAPAGAAVAAGAPLAVDECNAVFNDGGRGMNCDVTVVNYLNLASSVQYSVTTTVACDGAANTVPLPRCVTTIAPSNELVTSVNQCNSSLNGGGASLICHVHVTNQLYDPNHVSVTTAATTNQCQGSGIPGTAPTTNCNPAAASTTNATITQCNGSGNGGTASLMVICDVDPTSMITSALPVTVNQCNGSSNGGGATVVCGTVFDTQLLTLAQVNDTPTVTAASSTTVGTSNFVPTVQVVNGPAQVTPSVTSATAATAAAAAAAAAASRTTAVSLAATGGGSGPAPIFAAIALLTGGSLVLLTIRRRLMNREAD
jgi:hypothetical protein